MSALRRWNLWVSKKFNFAILFWPFLDVNCCTCLFVCSRLCLYQTKITYRLGFNPQKLHWCSQSEVFIGEALTSNSEDDVWATFHVSCLIHSFDNHVDFHYKRFNKNNTEDSLAFTDVKVEAPLIRHSKLFETSRYTEIRNTEAMYFREELIIRNCEMPH